MKNLYFVIFAIYFSFNFSQAFAGKKNVPPPVTVIVTEPTALQAATPSAVYTGQTVWSKTVEHTAVAPKMSGFPGDGKPASGWYQPPAQDAPIGTPVSPQSAQVVVSQPVYSGLYYAASPVYGGGYGYNPYGGSYYAASSPVYGSYGYNNPYGGSYSYGYRTAFAERGRESFRTYNYSPRRASWWGSYGAVGGGFGIGMRVGAPIHHITVRQYNMGVGVGTGVGVQSGLSRRGY